MLARQEETGRETAGRPVYGIGARPTELAFVNHFTVCTFCYPRSEKYCGKAGNCMDSDDGNPAISWPC